MPINFIDTSDSYEELTLQAANGDEQMFMMLVLRYEAEIRAALDAVAAANDAFFANSLLDYVVKALYGRIAEFPKTGESFNEWLPATVRQIVENIQPEELLLERAKAGDAQALGMLMMECKPRICHVVRKYLPYMKGFGDEDDIFHEVVLRAQPAIETFDGNLRALKNWLSITSCNLCKEIVRKLHPHVGGLQIKLIDVEDFVGHLFSDEPDPARNIVALEELGCAAQAFASLSKKHQDVLREKYGEDLKYKEIAQKFKVPIGTVSKRIHSAMQQFRKHLEFCEEQGIHQ